MANPKPLFTQAKVTVENPKSDNIERFKDEFAYLSNFYVEPLTYRGVVWPTLEHAYQAGKTNDKALRAAIRKAASPGLAKFMGQAVPLRKGWDDEKLAVMEKLLRIKFAAGTKLAKKLIKTGTRKLVEGNQHGDRFWGVWHGSGQNHLGKLLMKIRKELR